MLKVKSVYYEEWKYLRNRMEFAILNNNFTSKGKVPLEDTFMAYLEKKYKNKQIEGKNQSIIQEREQFLKEIKKNLSCQ